MNDTQLLDHLKIGCTYDAAKGHCCDDYHRLIAAAARQHAEKLGRDVDYIEIGTLTGNSAEAVLDSYRVRRAVLVDDFSLVWEGRQQTKEMVEDRLSPFAGRFEVIKGDSRKVVRNLTEMFDIGFVDGDHEEDSCRIDMTNMLPRLRDDGVMFVHDVGNPSFTGLLNVVGAFARDNNLTIKLHDVSDGLAELRRA